MKLLECDIEGPVCKWADERNLLHIKLNITGRRGFPDQLFFIPGGRPVLMELKRPGKGPYPLQQHILGLLEELDYDTFVTDSKEEAIAYLERCIRKALRRR